MKITHAGLLALVLVWGSGAVLTGCSTVPAEDPVVVDSDGTGRDVGSDDSDEAGDTGAARGDERIDCDGRDTTVADSDGYYELHGVCPTVTVEGADLEIVLVEAQVGTVIVRGDRIEVEAGDLTTVEIDGQGNEIEVASLGSLTMAGDRNDVDVEGILGSVIVNGNENDVESLELGDVQDNGDRNEIGTD